MKVTEQSRSRMVLMGSPLQQLVTGCVVIAMGLIGAVICLRHGATLGLLACLPIAGIGIYELVTARRLTVIADRSAGTVSIAWRSLAAAGERSVGIATIDRIAYREFVSEHRDAHGKRTDRDATSSLVLTDGSTVLLDRERDSSPRYSLRLPVSRDRSADKELAMFLGVSMIDNGLVVVAAPAQADQAAQAAQTPQPVQPAHAAQPTQTAQAVPSAQPVQAPQAAESAQAPQVAQAPGGAPAPAQTPSTVTGWPGGAMGLPTEHPPWVQAPAPAAPPQ